MLSFNFLCFSIVVHLICFLSVSTSSKECKKIDRKDNLFRSVVFAEAHGSGVGAQLFVYALMSQLRSEFYFDTYVSSECRTILSNVFTTTSLSDVPVFEDTFCVDHPNKIVQFEFYTKDIKDLINEENYERGKLIWLWPFKDQIQKGGMAKPANAVYMNFPFVQGYKPEEHNSVEHLNLMSDYKKRMSKRLRFLLPSRQRGDEIFVEIANKFELKPRDVTYIGIHNRRGADFNAWNKKMTKKSPFKKSYFYDAMDEMRESYDNVAFLYVSDDMEWAKKNLKDKNHDLFFVGDGDTKNPGFDLYLLAMANHTIMTRGSFSAWGANLAGGECYTEYGSIVPTDVMDKIEEETRKEMRRQKDQSPPGSESFNMDEEIKLFPTIINEEINDLSSILESWLHYILTIFY